MQPGRLLNDMPTFECCARCPYCSLSALAHSSLVWCLPDFKRWQHQGRVVSVATSKHHRNRTRRCPEVIQHNKSNRHRVVACHIISHLAHSGDTICDFVWQANFCGFGFSQVMVKDFLGNGSYYSNGRFVSVIELPVKCTTFPKGERH